MIRVDSYGKTGSSIVKGIWCIFTYMTERRKGEQ